MIFEMIAVPAVASKQELLGRWVTFTNDPLCRRQLIVLQDHSQDKHKQAVDADSSMGSTFDTLARGNASAIPGTVCDLDEASLDSNSREALLKKLSRQMGRGNNI